MSDTPPYAIPAEAVEYMYVPPPRDLTKLWFGSLNTVPRLSAEWEKYTWTGSGPTFGDMSGSKSLHITFNVHVKTDLQNAVSRFLR